MIWESKCVGTAARSIMRKRILIGVVGCIRVTLRRIRRCGGAVERKERINLGVRCRNMSVKRMMMRRRTKMNRIRSSLRRTSMLDARAASKWVILLIRVRETRI